MNETEQLIADLKGAKEVLAQRGRCTGNFSSSAGQVCLMGAVLMSMGFYRVHRHVKMATYPDGVEGDGNDGYRLRYRNAFDALRENCPTGTSPTHHMPPTRYNDEATTTDEDIYTLLDKTLAGLGGLGEE